MKRIVWLTMNLFLACIVFQACTKDEAPPYVGKWVVYYLTGINGDPYLVRQVMNLKESSFNNVEEFQQKTTGEWTAYQTTSGTLSLAGTGQMAVHINKVEVSAVDGGTGLPTGVMTTYNEGDAGFTDHIPPTGPDLTVWYSIENNEMTFKMDFNSDGDWIDDGEGILILTKIY